MKTKFRTNKRNAEAFIKIARETECVAHSLPMRFYRKMKENIGSVRQFNSLTFPEDDGLEARNPLIVVLGDSVTAGHFEFVSLSHDIRQYMEENGTIPDDAEEIIDVMSGYVDRFREKLIEKFERTSVSVINSGIAGDTAIGMEKRLDRDVIRYQPDLIIVNGTLNWFRECGGIEAYRKILHNIILRLKRETYADIIMLTPNAVLPTPFDNELNTLDDRVEIVRDIAGELDVCLVDVYKIWKEYEKQGYPVADLLANGGNHPSTVGHEVYAIALMKAIDKLDEM